MKEAGPERDVLFVHDRVILIVIVAFDALLFLVLLQLSFGRAEELLFLAGDEADGGEGGYCHEKLGGVHGLLEVSIVEYGR